MDFLFEIGVEELPSRYVDEAESSLKKLAENELKLERIGFTEIKSFSTPRRIAIIVKDIVEKQEDLDKKSVGPSLEVAYKDGKLTKAGEGFIKSQNALESDIKIIENEKGKYILIEKFIEGKKTIDILPELLKNVIKKIEFEKSMKWSNRSFRFARPIKWFVTLLENEILPFEFEGIKGGNKTRGMRYFAPQEIEIKNPSEYIEVLKNNFVLVEKEERKKAILNSIKENCENDEESVVINNYLLEEVINLIEYPYAIKGEFNKDYLELPEDIITITMETHQRYFPVKDRNGKLTNKFVVIRNAPKYSEMVKLGNEKVIEPRLADAKFFFDEDLKSDFSSNVEKLKEVTFQKDMGTIYEKINRSKKIAEYLIDELKLNHIKENILRTVELAKADLVSNVINEKEFTKLQGFMGSIYAEKQGEEKGISTGIFEHYLPRYQGDILPSTLEGAITGIADKIDTVVGCFSVGLKPTSSKDPYALRRAIQGIIQVVLNSNLKIDYVELIKKSYEIFKNDKNILVNEDVVENIIELFKQRILNVLGEKYSKELILYEINIENNIVNLNDRLNILLELSKTEDFEKLINLLKRIKNIVKNYENIIQIDTKLFEKEEEYKLFDLGKEIVDLEKGKFSEYIKKLLDNGSRIDNYFENVIINVENLKIKENRLSTLKIIENSINKVISL